MSSKGRVIVGLDIGGTTTKVVGFRDGEYLQKALVKASDPVASAYGALGKFIRENNLFLSEVSEVRTTGVGASYLTETLFELPTHTISEFNATGLGGLFVAKVERAIVVSMGTGTSIVYADQEGTQHVIGSGVGGGTLLGLSTQLLNIRNVHKLSELAEQGHLDTIDLSVGDISCLEIPGLSADTTASNFGKANEHAEAADLARGIVNLVFQSIGTASVLAARLMGVDTIVFTGNLSAIPPGVETLQAFSQLYNVRMLTPLESEFATAIGAAVHPV